MDLLLAVLPGLTFAAPDPLSETRYCGEPRRDAKGQILRRADVLVEFRKLYACPATGQHTGPCKGWAIDHVIPLAVGGCDAVRNLWPLERDHCRLSFESEVRGAQLPAAYRESP